MRKLIRLLTAVLLGTPACATAVAATTDGPPVAITVVVPNDRAPDERFPTVYLFNATYTGCVDETCPALAPLLARLRAARVVGVLPRGLPYLSDYVNWRSGGHDHEDRLLDLVDFVDRNYPTVASREHRAVGGISAGGYGAMTLAAHHPDLFSAVASFSGPVDITVGGPAGQAGFVVTGAPTPEEATAAWGDPARDELWWHEANPTDLARNMGSMHVYHSTGTGVPCPEETGQPSTSPTAIPIEALVKTMNDNLDAALVAAGVAHTYRQRPCGSHVSMHWARDIDEWLGGLRFGAEAPSQIRHRTAEPQRGLFGWSITADPGRAPEFLELVGTSSQGVTLRGSGATTVRTPSLFRPRAWVRVTTGDVTAVVRASRRGTVTISVDLGPPNREQQYAPSRKATGDPAVTRTVTFRALSSRLRPSNS